MSRYVSRIRYQNETVVLTILVSTVLRKNILIGKPKWNSPHDHKESNISTNSPDNAFYWYIYLGIIHIYTWMYTVYLVFLMFISFRIFCIFHHLSHFTFACTVIGLHDDRISEYFKNSHNVRSLIFTVSATSCCSNGVVPNKGGKRLK